MNPFDEKESKDRQTKFEKGYEALVKQYDCRLMAYPVFMPSGQQGFNIAGSMMIIDMKNTPIPSPLNDEIIK